MISEIDIKDWERSFNSLELYNCPRDSVVSLVEEPDVAFIFRHIDGMYSYCQALSGGIFHPAAWSPVLIWRKK
jgi:hypothetical protein